MSIPYGTRNNQYWNSQQYGWFNDKESYETLGEITGVRLAFRLHDNIRVLAMIQFRSVQ